MSYNVSAPETIAEFHRRVAASGSSPMDEPEIDGLSGAALRDAFADHLRRAAGLGLTGITEAGMRTWTHWDALVDLRERDELAIEVHILVASALIDDLGRVLDAVAEGDDRLAIAGVKFYADGWLGPRTCACSETFADVKPPDNGVLFQDADRLAARLEPVVAAGLRPATHAIGDRAIETALDAYERVYGGAGGCREARPRIEHAQLLRDDLIGRIVDLGVVCCIQPCFAASDARHMSASGLDEAFPNAYRWDRLLAVGARVVAGSDYPIETLDPSIGLEHLTSGEHPLTADDALRLMTTPLAGV